MTAINFVSPLLGLGGTLDYDLAEMAEAPGLYTLRGDDGLRLFLIDADRTFPDYTPVIDASELAPFGSVEATDYALYAIANVGDDGLVANLLAPIVLHKASNRAVQVILQDDRWPLQAKLSA